MSSSLEGNKLAASVLVAGIVAMLAGFVAELAVEPHLPEEDAYPIEVSESSGAGAVVEEVSMERDAILAMIAESDVMRGAKVAKKCASCHTFGDGQPNIIGPNLWDSVNRGFGTREGFSYSSALKERAEAGAVWDYETLFHFLESPRSFLPGTRMSFTGLSKPSDRAAVIEYLRNQSPNPPEIK